MLECVLFTLASAAAEGGSNFPSPSLPNLPRIVDTIHSVKTRLEYTLQSSYDQCHGQEYILQTIQYYDMASSL